MASPNEVFASWKDSLKLIQEEIDGDGKVVKEGLRTPQLGAFYRIQAHWSVSQDHAIVVLPTGVGKTDTMIALLVGGMCRKTLIIVPSKALRNQISKRIAGLGVLRKYDLIKDDAQDPIVKIQKKRFRSLKEIDQVCDSANVIIATASLFTAFPDGHLERLAANCTNLFLDEAHHSQAPETWAKIQKAFRTKPALLFTATPFRNDERFLQGEVIYNYPLAKAQREKYFTKIEQYPIVQYDPDLVDEAIAAKAVELLETDLHHYPKHLLMARVNTIQKAEKLFELYKNKYSQYNPILVHSNISEKARKFNQALFESGKSKIAVCVDMFGEGYDLPEIKIGAFHDMRKNVTTALQLIGRYTRSRRDLGTAKFVYNSVDENAPKEILKLIGEEDWNILIPNLSEGKTKKQQELEHFVKSFDLPTKLPLQNLKPAFSIVVYSTSSEDWHPENYTTFFKVDNFVSIKDLSNKKNTLVIVAAEKIGLDWIRSSEYFNIEHHLYIAHWIKDKKLLLIHSSKTGGNYFKELARALLGDDFTLVNGENVYRSLHKVERIKFHGMGLIEPFGKNVSYIHRNGSNVVPGTSVTDLFNRSKRVLQGTGYKNGDYINFGMTSKGRVWSFRRENISELVKWGQELAINLIDPSIKTDQLVKHVALPKLVEKRPELRPFLIEWADTIYADPFFLKLFDKYDTYFSIYDCAIQLHQPSAKGDIGFKVIAGKSECVFTLKIGTQKFEIQQIAGPSLLVKTPTKVLLQTWLNENPPTVYFIDGSFLVDGNQYTELGKSLRRYDIHRLITMEWVANGVDLTVESEKIDRSKTTSIQYFLINELVKKTYSVVFNDDDQDETADIVALSVDDSTSQIHIEMYHCKYSEKATPGCRLDDLYVVLGQAQKNMRWLDDNVKFIEQMIIREQKANAKMSLSRLRKGTMNDLISISRKVKNDYAVSLKVFAVQPGLSKAKFEAKAEDSNEMERLFAVTEDYIKATKYGEFYIICSP